MTSAWDNTQKEPYAFGGTEWIGYDDVQSVKEKVIYIKNNNLGGAMFWDVDGDDYNNICGGGKFPLISAAFNTLNGGSNPVSSLLI